MHKRFDDASSMEGPICSAVADYFIKNKLLIGMAAIVTLMPCIDCASALINCGVHTIVSKVPDNPELKSRWETNFELSKKLLTVHNTQFMLFDSDDKVLYNTSQTYHWDHFRSSSTTMFKLSRSTCSPPSALSQFRYLGKYKR